jgi:acetylornithine/N-succinyldiaminopimelate aminotransferase
VNAAPEGYLKALREIADEFGLLLIFDEVQCGMGRTGKLWAHEWAGMAPDIMASAKGLGGGFPVGAVLASEKAASGMKPGLHGSTFGGNPLAMAAANAVLDVILADGFLPQVERTAASLHGKLEAVVRRHPKVVEEVRGSGMLLGLKCVVPSGDLQTRLREEHGMLTVGAAENVLRLLPPLTIEEAHVDEAVKAVDAACAGLARDAA